MLLDKIFVNMQYSEITATKLSKCFLCNFQCIVKNVCSNLSRQINVLKIIFPLIFCWAIYCGTFASPNLEGSNVSQVVTPVTNKRYKKKLAY